MKKTRITKKHLIKTIREVIESLPEECANMTPGTGEQFATPKAFKKIDEIDINDPTLMWLRAAKNQRMLSKTAKKPKPSTSPYVSKKTSILNKQIQDLKAQRDSLIQDMEQEAEPEGGPIANRYGEELNNLDTKIEKLVRKIKSYAQAPVQNLDDVSFMEEDIVGPRRHQTYSIYEIVTKEDYEKATKLLDKLRETNKKLYDALLAAISDVYPRDISKEFGKELGLAENYASFRKETKLRNGPEQFHQAVKHVKKKMNEINRIFEYMDKLKLELSENGNLKYKKYTESAIKQIKESAKSLFIKSMKLK